jgi:hypothetical protein
MANLLVSSQVAAERAAREQAGADANAALERMTREYVASNDQQAARARQERSRRDNDPHHQNQRLTSLDAQQQDAALDAQVRHFEAAALAEAEAAGKAARVNLAIEGIVDRDGDQTTFGSDIPMSDFVDAVQDDVRIGVNPGLIQRVLTTGTHGIPGADKLADVWYERYARSPEMQEAHKRGDPTICLQAANAKYYKAGACDGPLSDKDVAYLRSLGARI